MDKKKGLTREDINRLQIEKILRHKWLISEKHGRDLGEEAVKDWIDKHASDFREYWENKFREMGMLNNLETRLSTLSKSSRSVLFLKSCFRSIPRQMM